MTPKLHTVESGECITSICGQYGYPDWRELYEHPANKELAEMRTDPSCLQPGDKLFVPEKKPYRVSVQTGTRTVIRVKKPKAFFVACIKDEQGNLLANIDYALKINDQCMEGRTDGKGMIEEQISARAQTAELVLHPYPDLPEHAITWEIKLGHLAPSDTPQGCQARLQHRCIACGPVDGDIGPISKAALKKFQRQNGCSPTGTLDEETADKIKHTVQPPQGARHVV